MCGGAGMGVHVCVMEAGWGCMCVWWSRGGGACVCDGGGVGVHVCVMEAGWGCMCV